MHRRGSSTKGRSNARVGQASRQRVHEPHRSAIGVSGVRASVVTTSPRSTNDPSPGTMSIPFFPTNPRPARAAQARSSTGTSSTIGRACTGCCSVPSVRRNLASWRSFFRVTLW